MRRLRSFRGIEVFPLQHELTGGFLIFMNIHGAPIQVVFKLPIWQWGTPPLLSYRSIMTAKWFKVVGDLSDVLFSGPKIHRLSPCPSLCASSAPSTSPRAPGRRQATSISSSASSGTSPEPSPKVPAAICQELEDTMYWRKHQDINDWIVFLINYWNRDIIYGEKDVEVV